MRDFENKVAVVTGAASGIGRAVALLLADRGCHLALVDVQAEALAETAALAAAKGRKTSLHVVDVSSRTAMSALPDAVLAQHGCVDILVNNAGIASGYTFEDHPIEHFERLIGVNLYGVVYGCKFFLPHLKQRPEAHIVNISSMFGLIGFPTQAAYSASKFAVRGLSQVLWVELATTPVRVTCVYPGGVHTNLVRTSPGWVDGVEVAQRQFEQVVRRTPDQAARKIVRAIERNTPNLRLGAETYVVDWLKRLLPNAPHRLMASLLRSRAAKQSDAERT
jgi:NAD(P)-dependent dehydrogenase (short-subunit alcohol dehydrogenase family)